MNIEEISIVKQSDLANKNYNDLLFAKSNIEANTLVVAKLLAENHDNSYWKILGYDSFESFLGDPEFQFRRSKAYDLIKLYKFYCQTLGLPAERLLKAKSSNLVRLMRNDVVDLVKNDTDEWLSRAELLSKSDLAVSIAEAAGKTLPRLSPPTPPSQPSSLLPRMTPEAYLKIVQHSPCINCGRSDTIVKAHFPRTRVRCEKPWHVIPLCPACHAEQEGSMEWCWKYRQNWSRWFYNLIAGE